MAWAPDYATLAAFKSYLRIPADDVVDDAELALAITTASREIDGDAGRQFGVVAAPEAREYEPYWDKGSSTLMVDVDDFQSVTGLVVVVDGTVVDSGDYVKLPRNAAAKGRPWERLRFTELSSGELATVTAPWGWTAVPDTVEQGTLIQANRVLVRRNSPMGIAGSPELGNELRLLARMDPDVALALRSGRYVRVWGAA